MSRADGQDASVGPRVSIPIALTAITLIGLLPRLAALHSNVWPHGDVLLDAAIAESLGWHGTLLVPIVDVRYYPTGRFGFGYPPDQHPPLWPLLGALLVPLLGDGYAALKAWGLLAGLAVVPLTFLAFRTAVGPGGALWASALVAVSFLLIDFSGNGSLWSALAALYLAFIWLAAARPLSDLRAAGTLGAIMGLALLVNYPGIILLPAIAITAAVRHGRGLVSAPVLRGLLLAYAVAALVALPWLAYNASLHGNPLWSQPLERQLGGGEKQVEVRVVDGEVIKVNRPEAATAHERLRTTAANLYGNVGFVLRQMLVLAPVMNAFAAVALIAIALTLRARAALIPRDSLSSIASAVAVLVCHGALALLWPTTKFRYLVPLLPLVFGLGTWLLWSLEPARLRTLLVAVAVCAVAGMGAWTWAAIPSHTYYYDGGVVTDNFGQQGETLWADDARRIARAASIIRERGPGSILGDHLFYYLARQPLVVGPSSYGPEALRALVDRYHVRYVWVEAPRVADMRELLPSTIVYEDDRYALLELR